MLPLIVKVINTSILTYIGYLIMGKNLNKKIEQPKIYIILNMTILVIPACILFEMKYNGMLVLLTYILDILIYKKLYNIKIQTSIISCGIMMLYLAMSDMIITSVNIHIVSYNDVRTNWYISLTNNIIVSILAYVISSLGFIKSKVQVICKKTELKKDYNVVLSIIFTVVIIVLIFYNITTIFKLNIYYQITLITGVGLLFLYYFYLQEHSSYEKLNEEYNILFRHVETFEKWIDTDRMYRHELKNTLSSIRNMTNNKEIIKKIDDILKVNIIVDDECIEVLSNIPKGDLKGILYYKIALAQHKKIKMIIEVSPSITKKFNKIDSKTLRDLCILLGIYIDNAIEAAAITSKKSVSIEIYNINNEINFVISNTYNQLLPIKLINKRGYTNKGVNHGQGLYYANKIVKQNKKITAEAVYLNNYYVEKIKVSLN